MFIPVLVRERLRYSRTNHRCFSDLKPVNCILSYCRFCNRSKGGCCEFPPMIPVGVIARPLIQPTSSLIALSERVRQLNRLNLCPVASSFCFCFLGGNAPTNGSHGMFLMRNHIFLNYSVRTAVFI